MSTIEVTMGGQPVIIEVGENTATALSAATAAQVAEAGAESAYALALAASIAGGNVYATKAAGLAAVAEGETFWSDEDGGVKLYRDLSGVATLLDEILTAEILADVGGAALIGTTSGETIQDYIDGPLPSLTFANRPNPATYVNKPGIVITNERFGSLPCYSDGTRWRRRVDGRTAQSAVINYYIDGTSGNDASAGTTSGTAIKTLTQLKALVAALPAYRRSGLRFAFKRTSSIGGFWFLDANNFGCIFEAYGIATGARPLFDCANSLVNASFVVDGTFANCYNITIAPNIETNPSEVPGVWVAGQRYSYMATKAECDAIAGTFTHPSSADQTSLVLTINSGSNPTSDGKLYEASIRSSAISTFAADECELYDLHGKRNYGSYGPFGMGNYGIAERLLCEDGNTHNIYYGAFSVLRDCVALNANYGWSTSATMFIGFDNPVKANATARLERCKAICTENTLKPPANIVGLPQASPTVVEVQSGHKFAIADYVTGDGSGGSTWINGARWYISAVSGNFLTLQLHDYTTNRIGNFDSRVATGLPAWTSGGQIKLVPVVANTVGFYSHGPGNGTELWDSIVYDRPTVDGCSAPISAADVRHVSVIDPRIYQYLMAFDVAPYAEMEVFGGLSDNTPALTGALAGRQAADSSLIIHGHTFTINSTGNFQLTGARGKLTLDKVTCKGFAKIVRGLGADEVIDIKGLVNSPNVNVSQSVLYDFNGSTTGLILSSDRNDFGGYTGGFTIIGTAHADLAAYKIATLQDKNSKA